MSYFCYQKFLFYETKFYPPLFGYFRLKFKAHSHGKLFAIPVFPYRYATILYFISGNVHFTIKKSFSSSNISAFPVDNICFFTISVSSVINKVPFRTNYNPFRKCIYAIFPPVTSDLFLYSSKGNSFLDGSMQRA